MEGPGPVRGLSILHRLLTNPGYCLRYTPSLLEPDSRLFASHGLRSPKGHSRRFSLAAVTSGVERIPVVQGAKADIGGGGSEIGGKAEVGSDAGHVAD